MKLETKRFIIENEERQGYTAISKETNKKYILTYNYSLGRKLKTDIICIFEITEDYDFIFVDYVFGEEDITIEEVGNIVEYYVK